ncbi:16S rRNA (uracil(1498)-N(3))-methyltransferase [Pontibacillus litoralis]|uniref:Ribosomal RNA small subunit methyltransferase E n=1 Tax=Pontibacillus litoralis JSM 072002 TaxID=1385512 RepID=A0A0A5GA50_9BACI|nr:16S rRNA (uracil(1498)-N(3))-methyltransferase [Pontibacillus litoralis]KGX88924.1 16S rRNA methyltransferase [Pontibacillus litoralis JSM 072002]
MQRYFVPASGWNDEHVIVTGDDVHHVTKVMRMKEEDHILCCNPDGHAALCEINDMTNHQVTCTILEWLEDNSELPACITIAQGLPKGDKMELVVQKGTELGACKFIPFEAERSIVKWDEKKSQKKLARYQKIAKEASEQAHRNRIPVVEQVHQLSALIEKSKQYDWKLFAYEDEARTTSFQSLKDIVPEIQSSEHVMIVIGPEGGFSEHEVEQLRAAQFTSVRLGPRILRTETASSYILAAISYQLEELR